MSITIVYYLYLVSKIALYPITSLSILSVQSASYTTLFITNKYLLFGFSKYTNNTSNKAFVAIETFIAKSKTAKKGKLFPIKVKVAGLSPIVLLSVGECVSGHRPTLFIYIRYFISQLNECSPLVQP